MKENLKKLISKNELLEEMFIKKEMELEKTSKEDIEYISKNHLRDITQSDLKNKILKLKNVSSDIKESLINDLDKVIENTGLIHSYSCKKYYFAGINDILNIIFNEENK